MSRPTPLVAMTAIATVLATVIGLAAGGAGRVGARQSSAEPSAPTHAYALGPGQMAVSAVTARYFRDSTAGQKLNQNCSVEVKDSEGNQVAGATVTVQMTGDWIATLSGQTVNQRPPNVDIYAHFGRLINGTCGKKGLDTFTCTVVNVSHPSLTYVPGENAATASTDDCFQ